MAGRREGTPALITSARIPKSLDADQRMKRYLWSMGVRVVCFVGAAFTPFPANLALLLGAAVIPGVAVLLANAIDHRRPLASDEEPASAVAALTSGQVVPGGVDHPEQAVAT